MTSDTGKWIIVIGIFLLIAGVIIYFFHDHLHWIGKLPGDIRVEKENFRFYFPVTTMIVLSLLLMILMWIIRKWQ